MNFKKNIPNAITILNLISGWVGIIQILNNNIHNAAIAIYAGAIFDFLDGLFARILSATSEIGKELDSLSDLVTFGILPSLIMYKLITQFTNNIIYSIVPTTILIAAALRLAKFNTLPSKPYFIGLPVTISGIFIATMPKIYLTNTNKTTQLVFISIAISLLSISKIKFVALKFSRAQLSIRSNYIQYIIILTATILISVLGTLGVTYTITSYILICVLKNLIATFKTKY